MGEALGELSGKLGLDTTDFKTGIAAANRELRVIESGFRASAASLGDWSKSSDGLEQRIGALTKAMDVQKLKVAALREEYGRVAKESGENSRAAKDLEIKINGEVTALGKMERELSDSETALKEMREGSDKATDAVEKLGKEAATSGGKLETFKKIAGGIGGALKGVGTAVAGVGVAMAGVGLAAGKLVTDAAASAGALTDLSAQTGLSTDQLQEFAYVGEQVGTSQETITGSLSKLIRSMDDARNGTGDAGDAFAALGIQVTDAGGNLRDNSAVFGEAIDALGKMSNETERDALSMALFGKSAQELNPLIAAGTDEINRLSQEAHDMGAVIDEDAVESLAGFDDTLAGLKMSLRGVAGSLAGALLPGFQGLADQAKGYMGDIADVVKDSDGDLGKAASGIGAVLGRAVSDLAESAPEILQGGLDLLKGIVGAVVENLPTLAKAAAEIITSLLQFIVENLPGLIDAGLQMVITLANALSEALPELIPAVLEVIPKIIEVLIENLPLLIDAALQLIIALVEGLGKAVPVLAKYIPEIVVAIGKALVEAGPLLWESAGELISALTKGFRDSYSKILEIGKGVVDGVWQGIQDNAEWLRQQVEGFFTGIVKGVKDVLGIKSPSRVFAGIGENMALGLGAGFDRAFANVSSSITDAVNGVSQPGAWAGSSNPQAAGAGAMTINVTMQGMRDIDARRAAQYIAGEIRRRA